MKTMYAVIEISHTPYDGGSLDRSSVVFVTEDKGLAETFVITENNKSLSCWSDDYEVKEVEVR